MVEALLTGWDPSVVDPPINSESPASHLGVCRMELLQDANGRSVLRQPLRKEHHLGQTCSRERRTVDPTAATIRTYVPEYPPPLFVIFFLFLFFFLRVSRPWLLRPTDPRSRKLCFEPRVVLTPGAICPCSSRSLLPFYLVKNTVSCMPVRYLPNRFQWYRQSAPVRAQALYDALQ